LNVLCGSLSPSELLAHRCLPRLPHLQEPIP
jgi:hypothetical protein